MHEDYGDYPLPLWWEQYEFDPIIEEFDWDEDYQPSEKDLSSPVGWDGFDDGSPLHEKS